MKAKRKCPHTSFIVNIEKGALLCTQCGQPVDEPGEYEEEDGDDRGED